jgi:Fur family ferric uptake transcriptional regulator
LTTDQLERLCTEKGLKMTGPRRVIAQVLIQSRDHPDVEQVHARAQRLDPRISMATVYRTLKLMEESGILTRHDFGAARSRYELVAKLHHDHLIDLASGKVVEFTNDEIERLQHKVAERLGYRLVGHRLELYAVPTDPPKRHEP